VICKAGDKATPRMVKKLEGRGRVTELLVPFDQIVGRYVAKDIINEETGEIWVEAGDELTMEYDRDGGVKGGSLKVLLDQGITDIPVLDIDNINVGPYIRNTMAADKNMGRDTALMDIYRVMRPGEPPTVEAASQLFDTLFFDSERYDLSAVGRVKMNMRLDLGKPGHPAHAGPRGHRRLHQGADRTARRQGRDRRHRPPWQPPRCGRSAS
jgi:DNA-directed RNA polymerase subunit beta